MVSFHQSANLLSRSYTVHISKKKEQVLHYKSVHISFSMKKTYKKIIEGHPSNFSACNCNALFF